ncbi:hypothetical protein C1H46_001426 [Malus baccata]|uniref:Uncharacterized protein n=1 Tax=Malus baccata TaxID=106549 RepID=A0A540NPU9_MALBA|nr:hypothetical protein C1H46_001426 [Malus baccata]
MRIYQAEPSMYNYYMVQKIQHTQLTHHLTPMGYNVITYTNNSHAHQLKCLTSI